MKRSRIVSISFAMGMLGLGSTAAFPQAPEVRDTVDVREAALLVELPERVTADAAAAALQVLELGVERPVTQVETLTGEWRVRVQVDPGFCAPESKRAALVALAAEARRLVELGPVELVVGSAEVEVRLAPSRDAGAVERALLEEAGRGPCEEAVLSRIAAALERLAAGDPPAEIRAGLWTGLARSARAATDAALLEPCAGGACLLVWVGGGTGPRPDLAAPEALRGPESESAVIEIERARRELAEGLGVQGWRVLALAGFGLPAATEPADPKSAAAGRGTEPPPASRVFPTQPWLEKQRGPAPEGYAQYLDFQLASLRTLAVRTAGALVDDGAGLVRRLDDTRRFVRVWIRTDSPRDGLAHEVSVVWTGRGGPRQLAASAWLVTRESAVLAAARARAAR